MASSFIGNEVPRKGLRVRVPCPPLQKLSPAPRDVAPWCNVPLSLEIPQFPPGVCGSFPPPSAPCCTEICTVWAAGPFAGVARSKSLSVVNRYSDHGSPVEGDVPMKGLPERVVLRPAGVCVLGVESMTEAAKKCISITLIASKAIRGNEHLELTHGRVMLKRSRR